MEKTGPAGAFREASRLFLRVRGLPAAEREEALSRATAGRAELRRAVEDLLRGDGRPLPFRSLAAGLAAVQGTMSGRDRAPGPAHLGPYRLLRTLGEGGFGVVFLAEQTRPVRRRVAVKVVKPGMDSREVVARFEAERQALALMDHPNITRILDAGTTVAGRPYFVMELVEGLPITTWCDQHKLTTRDRLRLFIPVCHAVQHAHLKGVIHRDLKPNNVLVVEQDGRPVPRIIDFGIAKALDRPLTDGTLFTRSGQFIGTPEYMSPEQAGGARHDVDTRSDVWSLGVLLYELLTGTTPFDALELRGAGYAEIQRIIQEVDPPAPSARIDTLASTASGAADIARRRRTDPGSLRRLVRGDLDHIVMKCLEKDPGQRYVTVHDLMEDLRRYLEDEPVSAGPPSVRYRMAKFARRHRVGLAAGFAVGAALLAGIVLAGIGFMSARRERDAAMQARTEAMAEARRAREAEQSSARSMVQAKAVSRYLAGMLRGPAPNVPPRPDQPFRELVQGWIAQLDAGALADAPGVEAEVRRVLADVCTPIGLFTEAEHNLRVALEIDRRLSGPRSREAADDLTLLSTVGSSSEYDVRTAIAEVEEALAIYGELQVGDDAMFARALEQRGVLFADAQRYSEAASHLTESLEMRQRLFGPESPEVARSLLALAMLHRDRGDPPRAEELLRKGIALLRGSLGPMHPDVARALVALAGIVGRRGALDEAVALGREALALQRRVCGPDHPDVAIGLNTLAHLLQQNHEPEEALELLQEAYDTARRALGEDHMVTGAIARELVLGLAQAGRGDEAGKVARIDLSRVSPRLPDHHPRVAAALGTMGQLLWRLGRPAESVEFMERTWRAIEAGPPTDPRRLEVLARNIALAWDTLGRPDEAARWRARAGEGK